MRVSRVCDRVPLPIRSTVDTWRKWSLSVADIMVETFPELSRPTLESEALFCAVSTVVYKIPTGCVGDIDTLTLHDVLYAGMEMLDPEVYLRLSERCDGLHRAFPSLFSKWSAALRSARVSCTDFSSVLLMNPRELLYWEKCGLHISSGTKSIVEAWLQVRGPWPVPKELQEFFITLRKE